MAEKIVKSTLVFHFFVDCFNVKVDFEEVLESVEVGVTESCRLVWVMSQGLWVAREKGVGQLRGQVTAMVMACVERGHLVGVINVNCGRLDQWEAILCQTLGQSTPELAG